ncbi:hypothetical protein BD410DRAFT_901952 [Rickenella mellea]|uniref:Protein kinase domain-containing protein n=1 Tax=Rickenella mellea TaxID=50990 RepID=A0A4Y7PM92_9AGAM|nr:hypothetical protein BD410DRAFT_901952 [Rickenella mellea]
MSSLVVDCAVNDVFPFMLTRLNIDGSATTPDQPSVRFTGGKNISYGERVQVYRGKLHHGEDTVTDAAVKFDLYNSCREDLVRESALYEEHAKTLQGTVVPTFYGIYHGIVDERPITCLVLEDCGDPIETWLHDASVEFSFKVAQHLMKLHSVGLQHNNISETNIVVKNGEPRLIDFSNATPHICGRKMEIVCGAPRPKVNAFACKELHNFASRQGIWEATDIFYYGAVVPKRYVTSAEYLLDLTPPHLIKTAKGRERILREASEIMSRLGIAKEKMTPEV